MFRVRVSHSWVLFFRSRECEVWILLLAYGERFPEHLGDWRYALASRYQFIFLLFGRFETKYKGFCVPEAGLYMILGGGEKI